MRIQLLAIAAGLSLFPAANCEAGGFFRRVPEMGEWARYEINLTIKTMFDDKMSPPQINEMTGVFQLRCVGEETVDDRRYLWIECRADYMQDVGGDFGTICKLLVPEDQIIAGNIPLDEVRGWNATVGAEPKPIRFSSGAAIKDNGWWWLMMLFGDDNATETEQGDRAIVVNDNGVQLDCYESWPIPEPPFTDSDFVGHMNWWLNDDLACGVASMDYSCTVRHQDSLIGATVMETRFDLVATGTDAVSDLPDHN